MTCIRSLTLATVIAIAGDAHAERYVVQRGETLEHVAQGHGCAVEAIERANGLKTTLVKAGTVIELPTCSLKLRARTRPAMSHHADAASPDDAKARQALAVIDGASWITTAEPSGDASERAIDRADHDHVDDSARAEGETIAAWSKRVTAHERRGSDRAEAWDRRGSSIWDRRLGEYADAAHERESIGVPWNGRLEHGEHLEAGDGYEVRRPSRAYGAGHVVEHLRHAIAEVRALYPDVHTLAIGDLSAEHGGKISDHHSHQSGLDVDVGFYFTHQPAGYPAGFAAADANLDLEATWALLAAFARTAPLDDGVAIIFLDYAVQRRLYDWARKRGTPDQELELMFQYPRGSDATAGLVRHWPEHANHFHVRFKPAR